MSEYKNDIDELFYEGVEAHRELPATNVWKEIETELNKEAVTVYKKKYGKLKKSFALLLLLFMGFLVYDILNTYVFDGAGKTAKQEIAPLIESTGKAEQTNGIDKSTGQQPVKNNVKTNATRETGTGKNIQHKFTAITPHNNQQNIISSQAGEKEAVGKDIVTKNEDQNKAIAVSVNQHQDVLKDVAGINNKEIQPVVIEENGKIIADNPVDNKESALIPAKDDAAAAKLAVIDDNEVDQQAAGDDDLSPLTYQNTYIGQLRNFSPGLFGMPLIITDAGKKNLLNGLWPAAENLARPSLLYVPEPVMLKEPALPAKQRRFFLLPDYTSYTSFNVFTDNKPNRFNNTNTASTGAGSTGGSNQGQVMSGARRNENFNFIRQSESVMMAHSFGLKAGYQINSKLSIATGLNYTTVITDLDPKYIYARNDGTNVGFDLHTTLGSAFLFPRNFASPVAGDSMWLSDSRNTARYIGIPLTIGYKLLSSKRFSLETFTGGQYNLLLRGNTWGILDKGTATQSYVSEEMTPLRSSYFSVLAGLNGELWLGRNVSFVISPTGQFALSYINQGGLIRTRPNYFGLSGGMRFRF